MARTSKKKELQQRGDFAKAIEFVALAQRETGSEYETHCKIKDGYMTGFDGVLAAGCPISEDLSGCPNTHTLLKAMKQCKEADVFSLSQSADRLLVKANNFRVSVPCIALGHESIPNVAPDPIYTRLPDDFDSAQVYKALAVAFSLIVERAHFLRLSSVGMTQHGTCLGTNDVALVENFHGLPLTNVTLPYRFVEALLKVNRPITALGMSEHSVTFYFQGDWWMRSQLMDGDYPFESVKRIFETDEGKHWMNWREEAPLMTDEIGKVGLFSKDDFVSVQGNTISADELSLCETSGTYFQSTVRVMDWVICNKLLNMFDCVNFLTSDRFVLFSSDTARGVMLYAIHS